MPVSVGRLARRARRRAARSAGSSRVDARVEARAVERRARIEHHRRHAGAAVLRPAPRRRRRSHIATPGSPPTASATSLGRDVLALPAERVADPVDEVVVAVGVAAQSRSPVRNQASPGANTSRRIFFSVASSMRVALEAARRGAALGDPAQELAGLAVAGTGRSGPRRRARARRARRRSARARSARAASAGSGRPSRTVRRGSRSRRSPSVAP